MSTDARTYYSVPTHYSIGPEFDDLAEAVRCAKAKVQRFFYRSQKVLSVAEATLDGSWRIEGDGKAFYSRAFIDRRVKDSDGDRCVERIEVFLTDAEKDALVVLADARAANAVAS